MVQTPDVDHLLLEGLRRALFAGMMDQPNACEGEVAVTNMGEVVVGSDFRVKAGSSRPGDAALGGRHES